MPLQGCRSKKDDFWGEALTEPDLSTEIEMPYFLTDNFKLTSSIV